MRSLQLTKAQLLQIFDEYMKSLLVIKNVSKRNIDSKRKELVEHSLRYTKYIDGIFSYMKSEDANFLKKVFIQKIHRSKMDYSTSGYYLRINQSINEFFKFFDKSIWLTL